jgi:saposin
MPKPIRNECSAFVATYGPLIISLLIKHVDPKQICQTIGACPKTQSILTTFDSSIVNSMSSEDFDMFILSSKPDIKLPKSPKKEITCSLCKLVMQYIDSKMEIDRTQEVIKLTVDNMCSLVSNKLRAACDSMAEKYGVKLIDFINQHTDPEIVCAHIKICRQQQAQEIDWLSIEPSAQYIKKVKFTGFDDNQINSVKVDVHAKNGSLECSLCLYVAELADTLLKQNKTDEQIVKELELVCNLFPSNLKDQCNAFMNEYGSYVLQLLAADLDPATTCAVLKLCDKTIIGNAPRRLKNY